MARNYLRSFHYNQLQLPSGMGYSQGLQELICERTRRKGGKEREGKREKEKEERDLDAPFPYRSRLQFSRLAQGKRNRPLATPSSTHEVIGTHPLPNHHSLVACAKGG